VWVALAIAIPAVVLSFVLLRVILHRESTDARTRAEKRHGGRTDEETLVKAYIINNAGKDAVRVKFLKWGPHLDEAELRGLMKEAGVESPEDLVGTLIVRRMMLIRPDALPVVPGLAPLRAIVRVSYRGPMALSFDIFDLVVEATDDKHKDKDHDRLFLVFPKTVMPFGAAKGGDRWKGALRDDLSRDFPAVKRP
jgi:hypothetical protein